ncbi:tonB-system energizer ExbB [Aureimonas ureilytica]|uniref:tonB-system energizer ExbB n=1 Tax=Aureimonas ureilytica TaxID=401562 RepID=UPI000368BE38|nr:tonB-system energizer ExbB [Aureimonas ureilytica]
MTGLRNTAARSAKGAARHSRVSAALLASLLLAAPALAQDGGAVPAPSAPAATTAAPAAPAVSPAPAPAAAPTAPAASTTPAPAAPSTPAPAAEPAASAATPSPASQPAPDTATASGTTLPAFAGDRDAPASEAPASEAPAHDLSPWGMFMAADIVVKAVMAGLAFASVVTWTIWLAKVLELAGARRRAQSGVRRLGEASGLPGADGLEGAGWRRGPVANMVRTAVAERERSSGLPAEGVKERVATALQRIEARAGRRMARGTGLLATIGSTAPFVGLFGTVWGIMNSFIGISKANTTNLAVVAPGIAEALLATAIGLVAAIPAVIIYNVFARAIAGYKAVLADASAGVLQHLSRDLDRAKSGAVLRGPARVAAE